MLNTGDIVSFRQTVSMLDDLDVKIGLHVWYTQVWVCEDRSSSLVFSGLGVLMELVIR